MVEPLSRSLSRMFHNISNSIETTKDQLSALNGAIGDADHGVTMSIGFQAVRAELSRRDIDTMAPADLLDTAAMVGNDGGLQRSPAPHTATADGMCRQCLPKSTR